MNTFVIEGGRPLSGTITVAGNKNAALPMLAATLLTDEPVRLENVPDIRDVRTMLALLDDLGVAVEATGKNRWTLAARAVRHTAPPDELAQEMRASFVLVGPLLARYGRAEMPTPGGDRIGRRPLDTHIAAFEALGATVEVRPNRYILQAPGGLRGADIFLDEMSVMATENAIMAASLAAGTSVLRNAASEPHVQDLCHLIVRMGGQIEGIGTNTLCIEGQSQLHGTGATVGPDYLEVGSFIALAAMTGGHLLIQQARPEEHRVTAVAYGRLGVRWECRSDDIFVPADQALIVEDGLHDAIPKIHDAPWPGFPADLTSIALVLATQARGTILIHEWMYENRLYWVDRLISMGGRVIVCDPHRAVVVGPARLYGQVVTSPDIRAGMALLIAALAAEGRSLIHNAQQIDRGYENIDARLRALGAQIERV
ncbi:MAG: UDP-N-acetylglucosamine 1-carboxyvinyltransferase [Ardenticatenaceae bacterium]|nr:UDP-N-acetylglucosamine 1-carboxyvinyltransferase [Ardenticatenaceae bacterium]HBY98827.1 UDP-N-acetylglucosamine 1-carboxyvinyltransferase [Chloroflexota bacterium]